MKDPVVERVLATVLEWGPAEVADRGSDLQALASLKFDEYEGYRPGEGFLEHLTSWLWQMDPADRVPAVEFVERNLVFISKAELSHAIETVYPDIIRPLLVEKASARIGVKPWQVREIVSSPIYRELHRKTLVLALGDGAQIDRLRRSSDLSHEQFYVAPELSEESVERMQSALQDVVGGTETALFEQVILVDDFAGSGYTSIRLEGEEWGGLPIGRELTWRASQAARSWISQRCGSSST